MKKGLEEKEASFVREIEDEEGEEEEEEEEDQEEDAHEKRLLREKASFLRLFSHPQKFITVPSHSSIYTEFYPPDLTKFNLEQCKVENQHSFCVSHYILGGWGGGLVLMFVR